MLNFLWVLTIVGSLFGGLALLSVMVSSTMSAPQEAAMAAFGIGLGVLPYVLARASQQFDAAMRRDNQHRDIIAALRAIKPAEQSAAPVVHADTAPGIGSSSPTPIRPTNA